VFVVGLATFLLAYVAFAVTGASVPMLAGGFALAGCGIGIVETSEHATVADYAPDSIRGSAFGVLAAIQSMGNVVASSVAGLLWTLVSPSSAFAWAEVWMIVSLLACTRFKPADS
jgi:MFS family permease